MNFFFIPTVLCFLPWVLFLGGCERDRGGDPISLIIENNSSNTIVAAMQFNYPDTTLQDYNTIADMNANTIPSYSEMEFYEFTGWENAISERNPSKTLIVVIYSSDTLDKYTWSDIQKNYNILKRYDLTIEDLRATTKLKPKRFVVTYP